MNNRAPENTTSSHKRDHRGDRQIFLCDASAEAGRLLTALQTKGYAVVDVPLGLLISRCRYEWPEVVICDADAHEAETKLAELTELKLEKLKVILLGQKDGTLIRSPAIKSFAHSSFVRPIEIEALVEHISALCSAPRKRSYRPRVGRPGNMPSLVTAARKPYRSDGGFFELSSQTEERDERVESGWSSEAPVVRLPGISDATALSDGGSRLPSFHSTSPSLPPLGESTLSRATLEVLERGRKRLDAYPKQAARPVRLSVGALSIGCDLRPDLLAALQEPLDETEYGHRAEDDSPESTSPGILSVQAGSTPGLSSEGSLSQFFPHESRDSTRAPSSNFHPDGEPAISEPPDETNPGGRPGASHPPPGVLDVEPAGAGISDFPSFDDLSDLISSPWGNHAPIPSENEADDDGAKSDLATTRPPRRPQSAHLSEVDFSVLGQDSDLDDEAFLSAPSVSPSLFLDQAKTRKFIETERQPAVTHLMPSAPPRELSPTGQQPILHQLLARAIRERTSGAIAQQDRTGIRRVLLTDGDITTVISALSSESLAHFLHTRGQITPDILATLGAVPAFGRHAGAALIARGLLQQEDLWPILRAHSEWILGRALSSTAAAVLEVNVPQRMLDEPAVFGGAAGTEIYLEALRRVISPKNALIALGGGSQALGRGPAEPLLGESALSAREQQLVWELVGQPLDVIMRREPRLLPLLLGLSQLGVLTSGGEISLKAIDLEIRDKEIDEQAFISKVSARRALVENGDYFAILGITRSATSYEVDRARDELLSLYSDTRLTARTLHLRSDLELLRSMITEAHLVLSDEVRRHRYKRALEANPN